MDQSGGDSGGLAGSDKIAALRAQIEEIFKGKERDRDAARVSAKHKVKHLAIHAETYSPISGTGARASAPSLAMEWSAHPPFSWGGVGAFHRPVAISSPMVQHAPTSRAMIEYVLTTDRMPSYAAKEEKILRFGNIMELADLEEEYAR